MSLKGARAENIRKLTAAQLGRLAPRGGVPDERVPDAALAVITAIPEIDADRFAALFGPRLARYTDICEQVENRVPAAEARRLAEEACELADELRKRLNHLPDLVRVQAQAIVWGAYGTNWTELQQAMGQALTRTRVVLDRAAKALPGRAGRSSMAHRDALARDVVAEIAQLLGGWRGTRERAIGIAQDLLAQCGVPIPDDPDEFKKLLRGK